MAMIQLTQLISWDTTKQLHDQTPECKDFVMEHIYLNNMSTTEDEYCGMDSNNNPVRRPLVKTHANNPLLHNGNAFLLTERFEYAKPANDREAFKMSKITHELTVL